MQGNPHWIINCDWHLGLTGKKIRHCLGRGNIPWWSGRGGLYIEDWKNMSDTQMIQLVTSGTTLPNSKTKWTRETTLVWKGYGHQGLKTLDYSMLVESKWNIEWIVEERDDEYQLPPATIPQRSSRPAAVAVAIASY